MITERQLDFSVFIIYALAENWNMPPRKVYSLLSENEILDNYIIECYDILHTLDREYLVNDITEFAREKGINV